MPRHRRHEDFPSSERLGELAADHGIVGCVLGESVAGRRSVVVHGLANVVSGLAVDRSTAFLAGSVTKAMTASIVAMLVGEGRVELDAVVRTYVPEFVLSDEHAAATITVRHLLTHTSGFDGDIWPDHGEGDDAIRRLTEGLSEVEQLTEPGVRFSYNNAGYAVLGRLIERVLDAPFESVLRDRIAVPSGAEITSDVRRILPRRFAVGHVSGESGPAPVATVVGPACLAPAGSRTWATVDDLLAFGELHLGRHGDADLHRALVTMRSRQVDVADPNNGGTMGLGVFLDDRWGTPVVFHDGGVNGQAAYLRVLPEDDAVLVVMTTGGVPQAFHRHALRLMAARLGREAPRAAVADPSVSIDPVRYVGRYAASATVVDIERDGDTLVATITWGPGTAEPLVRGSLRLAAVDDRVFLTPLDGRDYVFVFPPSDEPCDHLLAGLRLLRRQ